GVPMPRLMAKSAAPPRTSWPVWLMTRSAATSAGPTQVVTMSADSAPMTATPPKLPALWRLLRAASRLCTAAGICTVNRPSMDSAIATKIAANRASTHHVWNSACTSLPIAAPATPAEIGGRHLHREQAQHGQRHRHEDRGEQGEHPPRLEQRLHFLAHRRSGHAGRDRRPASAP